VTRAPRAVWPVIAVCAVVALALRAWWLARPGHLLGVTETDDGILFGNAIRLVNGVIPYRDFSDVQPPGSFLLMAPVAALGRSVGSAWGLAIARILTVAADTGCVLLIGRLVRHRGRLTVGIACGIYAVYPDALVASRTFLLEPWLNLCCLAGAVFVFEGDRFTTSRRRVGCAGVAFGFAVAVKLWALVPLALVAVMLVFTARRRLGAFGFGAVVGFGVPALPFWLLAPGAFVSGVFSGQFVRSDAGRHLVLSRFGDLAGHLANTAVVVVLAVAGAVVVAGYAVRRAADRPGALDVYAVTGAAAVVVMMVLPRLYYAHYGAFAAPFLALALALPAGRLAASPAGRLASLPADGLAGPRVRTVVFGVVAAVVLTGIGVRDLVSSPAVANGPSVAIAERLIPAGACVLTDAPSYTVAADRFTSVLYSGSMAGCPALVDAQGTLIAMTGGKELGAPPAVRARVTALWAEGFGTAGYVWIFPGSWTRIPWTPALRAYLASHFRLIAFGGPAVGGAPASGLYARTPSTPAPRQRPHPVNARTPSREKF
jgi:hypothetical protein